MSIHSWTRWVVVATAVLLPILVSVPAKSVLEVSLEYAVPSGIGCPNEAEFRAAVAERLETDPFVRGAPRTLAVEIIAKDGRLSGWLRWMDGQGVIEGQRRFEAAAADCPALARNMAFAVTVQLQLLAVPKDASPPPDTGAFDSETQAEAAASPVTTTTTTTTATAPAAAAPGDPAAAPTFEVGAGVGPFLISGWTPDLALGGRAVVLARAPRFLVQLAFEASLPQRHEISEEGSGFESSVVAASVAPCYRGPVLEACPVLRVGQVRVRGFGVDEPESPRTTLWEAGLRLGAGGALWASLEGKMHLELSYTLSPWTVRLNDHPVFDAPSFVLLGGIDLIAFFL